MYCFVILLLFNEMQMSVRRFSAIPHLRENSPPYFVKRKAQNAVVLSLKVADGMVKATLKQLGKRFNSFYISSDLYLYIWSFWNVHRATTSAGKPVPILRGIAEKMSSFLPFL